MQILISKGSADENGTDEMPNGEKERKDGGREELTTLE